MSALRRAAGGLCRGGGGAPWRLGQRISCSTAASNPVVDGGATESGAQATPPEPTVSAGGPITGPSLQSAMIDARVHLGHAPGVWNPKMAGFIAGKRAGIHLLDLDQTELALRKALFTIRGVVNEGGTVLFVNTRPEFETITRRAAVACGECFVTKKWVSGTLTNSETVLGLKSKPDLIVMMSMPVLYPALKEASQLCIPTIGLVDTNCDPSLVTIPIPANDDTDSSIRFFLNVMCNTIIDVKEHVQKNSAKNDRSKTYNRRH